MCNVDCLLVMIDNLLFFVYGSYDDWLLVCADFFVDVLLCEVEILLVGKVCVEKIMLWVVG